MKKQPDSRSAFFNSRFLIGFAFCTIAALLALLAFALYPGGNALAKEKQSSVPELPQSSVQVLQASPAMHPPMDEPVSQDRAVDLPINSVDLGALGVKPLPFPLSLPQSSGGPDSGAVGPGKAFLQMTNDIVNQSTGSAFAVLSTGWIPGENVQGYVNGTLNFTFAAGSFGAGTPIGYLGVTFNTGSGFGYLTVEEKGVTSGRTTGGVVQVSPTGPYLPGVAGAPHAENTSGASPVMLFFGTGYPVSSTAQRFRNGTVNGGTTAVGTSGTFFIAVTPAASVNTSAAWTVDTVPGTAGSMNGTSMEERSDAGGPSAGDQNLAWAFVDRAVINSATGGTFAVSGEGFTPGETVTISGSAAGSLPADGNGAASFFITAPAGAGFYSFVLTGGTSARVARASVLAHADSTNRRGLLIAPALMNDGAPSTFTVLADKLPASAPSNVYLDGVLQGTVTANTAGFASVLLSKPTATPGFILHEVGWIVNPSATPDAQAAGFLVIPAGPTPTATATVPPTPTATPSAGCVNYGVGNSIGAIVTAGTDIGNHCDDCETAIALPFPVTLYGNTYTSANAGSNGYLSFNMSAINFYTGCLPNNAFSYTIFPWAVDQITAQTGGGIFTQLNGTAPNRTFYIEWRACQYGTATTCLANSGPDNYEVVFNENDPGNFSIVYGGTWGTADATVGAIGVQGVDGTQYSQPQCNMGRPAANRQIYTQCPAGTPSPTPTATATVPPPTPTPPVTPTPTATPCVVLYAQTDTGVANAVNSQMFAPADVASDNQAADDFVVPAGPSWNVQKVVANGVYFNGTGPAPAFNVYFYNNAGTIPGSVVSSQLNVAYTCSGTCDNTAASDYTMYLPTPVTLTPGTYWVSVQAHMDFAIGGQWGWTDRTTVTGSPAAWQNPGGGFATACNSWGARGALCAIDAANPDQIFQILGCLSTPATINISGNILQCNATTGNPMQNATMTMTGSNTGSTLTDISGNYTLAGVINSGTTTVTPTKAQRPQGSSGINTTDAVAIQRHFLIIGTPLSGCRLVAADVNGSGTVNTTDAIATQRFFLIQGTGTANVGKYVFSPVSTVYPMPLGGDQTTNYTAVVLGDVASAFVPGAPRPEIPPGEEATIASTVASLALPDIAVDQSKSSFVAAVKTSEIDAKSQLVGFQGDLTFDERVVSFESQPVQAAGLTANNWIVSGNVLPGPGPIRTLRISAFATEDAPLSGAGTLFELRMTRVSNSAQATQLVWAQGPDQFIFIDANLSNLTVGNTAPGNVKIK